MKHISTKVFSITLIALLHFSGYTQVQKIWEKPISSKISWQRVTSLGNLIVCTSQALEGVDTENGNINWDIDYLNSIPESSFAELPGSPFFKVDLQNRFFLIDQFNGRIVFDSKDTGIYDISSFEVLSKSGVFLVSGNTRNQDQLVVAVDISNASILWRKLNEFKVVLGFEELENNEFILVSVPDIYRLNAKTGEQIWKNTIDSQAQEQMEKLGGFGKLLGAIAEEAVDEMQGDFYIQYFGVPDKDMFLIGAESKSKDFDDNWEYSMVYRAYKLSDGSELWMDNIQVGRNKFKEMAKTIELDGKMGQVLPRENDILILSNNTPFSTTNLFDIESGKGKWGQVQRDLEPWGGSGKNIRGSIYEYLETDQGVLLATTDGSFDYLHLMNPNTGESIFKRPIRIEGPLVGIVPVSNNVLYLTENSINILNPATGEKKWKKGLSTFPELTAEKDGKIYFHDKKTGGLKALDLSSQTVSDLNTSQLNFQGKETPENLELTEDGIVLYSSQNIAKYDYNGTLLFNTYFPAPKESGFQRGLNIAGGILMAFIAADSYYTAGKISQAEGRIRAESPEWSEFAGQLKNAYAQQGDNASAAMNMAFGALKNRKKATTATREYNLIMTKRDKDIVLLKVSKQNGEVEGEIVLGRDRDPIYAIDEILGHVYYLESGKSLVGYKIN